MLANLLIALSLAADPAPRSDLDIALAEVQCGATILAEAVAREPAPAPDPFVDMSLPDNAEIAREGMVVAAINDVLDAFDGLVAP